MFNLSGSEMVFLLLIALVVLGPEKLPEAVRKFGKTYGELKKMSSGFQSELRSALDEPMKEMRETADTLRQAVSIDFEPERVGSDSANPATPALQPPATSQSPRTSASPTVPEAAGSPGADVVPEVPVDPAMISSPAFTSAAPQHPAGDVDDSPVPSPAGDFAPMLPDDALPDRVAGE